MSVGQWIFHYVEVMKFSGKHESEIKKELSNIKLSIQAGYLLHDDEKGKKLIDIMTNIENPMRAKKTDNTTNDTNDNDNTDTTDSILTDTDKELLEFADSLPKTMELPNKLKHTGKFILPKQKISDIMDKPLVEVVDELSEKPKLGL